VFFADQRDFRNQGLMPLYEYQCDVCVHRFEVIQKFSDPHIDICPKCGGAVHKLFSSPAIQFKGSGFYITDYARAAETRKHGETGKESRDRSDATESRNHGETASKTESKSESGSESNRQSKSESTSDSKSTGTTETKSESKPASSTPGGTAKE
jgi:putative FmdB family regulatory protein